MRFVTPLALSLMLVTGAGLAVAPQAAVAKESKAKAPKLNLSKAFADGFNAALAPLNAGDYAGAKAAWQALQANISNEDEKYQSGILGFQIGARSNDRQLQYQGAQQLMASQSTPAEDKAKFTYVAGVLNPDPAAGLQQQVQAYNAGYRDETVGLNIANAYYKAGDAAQGSAWAQKYFDEMKAAGKPVPLDFYALTLNAAIQGGDRAGQLRWSQALMTNSLIPDHWRVGMDVAARAFPSADSQVALDMFRLQRQAKAMLKPDDYRGYVEAADPVRLPGEVVSVLNEGKAAGVLRGNEPFYTDAMGKANGRIAADKASLANAERDAQAARDGRSAQGSADALLAYGEYAKAASLYETALAKGGVDAGRVNTRLGIAKVKQNDLAGAKAAFEKVASGPWKTNAQYWLIYLQARANNAPTSLQASQPAAPAKPAS